MKVFNDPVYGFIEVRENFLLNLINHPYFQKLRRIKQLGTTEFVYPGAVHTRFQHALGAMHLMEQALSVLEKKGVSISQEERTSCKAAILLHDIGHGPFSHSLERILIPDIKHETISYLFMQRLNSVFKGQLELTMKIFRNSYERKFFHDLISSQLDMDRLDYMKRDSYFTGVPEGNINTERLIQLLNVKDGCLFFEEKAQYSVENFLNARRLMYWQVYLHKTSIGIESLVTAIIKRARELYHFGTKLAMTNSLEYFFSNEVDLESMTAQSEALEHFSKLDDTDIWGSIKIWRNHSDFILRKLCGMFINRELLHVNLSNQELKKEELRILKQKVAEKYNILISDTHYFVSHGPVTNEAYIPESKPIYIGNKAGELEDIALTSDLAGIKAMSKKVLKYYRCAPKEITI